MESTSKRIIVAILLLVVFAVGVQLRFTGLDWALRDGGTPHPDERHVINCINHIYLETVPPRGDDESLLEYWKRYWRRQLIENRPRAETGIDFNPPLRPVNYNYGTFPFYCYKIAQAMTADDWSPVMHPAVRLILLAAFLFFILRFCRSMRPTASRPGSYLKILPLCILLPVLGLFVLAALPGQGIDVQNIAPRGYTGIVLIGRLVTALCGSLTVLLLYLIGRDAYGRWTGLLAAAFLAVAVLHVQLSHFATVDIIVAFWIVAAIFCFHRIALRPRLVYYILGAIATGFAIGSKWSAVTLPGILLLAHAIGTWGEEKHGQTGRWINTVWLIVFGAILAHFFRAASSTQPTFNVTLAAFRDFYVLHRWHVGLLFLAIFLISVLLLYCQSWWRGDGRWGGSLRRLYRPWLFLLIAVPLGVGALFVAEPLAFLDSAAFAKDVCEQHGIIVTGKRPVPFTQQYVGTMPIFYLLDNLFYPSLDWVTAFFAVAGLIFSIYMAAKNRHRSDILLLAWVLPNFLLYSTFLCKFPRYLITVLPFFLLFGARLLVAIASLRPAFYSPALASWPMWAIRGAKRAGVIGIVLSLLCALVYGLAFVGIYNRPHTYRVATDWLRDHDALGKRILSQSWDEWLPGIPGPAANLELHTAGDREIGNTLSAVAQADYLVLPSKRAYGTTFRLPKRFPLINRFFRLLFSEQLGYELAATITSEPVIGFGKSEFFNTASATQEWPSVSVYDFRWELSSDLEDESFRVYDHPKVVIFRNVKRLKASQMREAVMNPPDWLEKVTWEHILRARAGPFILEPETKWPALSWYLGLQVLSLCAFIFIFSLCYPLADRGYAISKILGLILFSWISWFLASTGLFPLSRAQLVVVLLCVIGFATLIGYRRRTDLRSFWLANWRLLVGMEILFLVFWGIFLCIRAHHPDVYWGEKPMEFSFINTIYRTSVFPPIDPWISGRPINYYYYGYVVYALLGRLLAIPAAYVFNLGVASVPALLGIASFGLIYNVCRSWKAGILGSYLILFSGHLVSYGRFIQSYRRWVEDEASATGIIPTLTHWFTYLPFALKTTGNLFLSALGFVERAPAEGLRFLRMHGGTYFWTSGHDVIPGTAANEFPSWSFYFADFHPHMMVMPMTVAALGLALALLLRTRRERSEHITSSSDCGLLCWFALVLGSVWCTNTWDLPGLAIVLFFALLIRFMNSSSFVNARIERGPWISPRGFSVVACDLFVPLVATLFVAWALFVPFHNGFVSRVAGVRWMTEGNTPLVTMLAFFGVLLWPCVVLLAWRAFFPRGLGDLRWKRLILAGVLCVAAVVAAQYINRTNPFDYPPAHTNVESWALPSDYTSASVLLPFLVLSLLLVVWSKLGLDEKFGYLLGLLGLGILFGCEFVFVKEGWSEPSHRWNTVFKFYLQAWIYLGLFAGIAACFFWRDMRVKVAGVWRPVRRVIWVGWGIVTLGLLLASVIFPIAGAFSVTLTDTNDNRGLIPSLDGMSYMVQSKPDEYRALQFINYAFDGMPVILEAHGYDRQYQEFSRVSMNTGCPTVLGWAHHVGERLHHDEIPARRRAVDEIYATRSVNKFMELLGTYDVDFIYYGKQERRVSPGCERRWSSWGHILDLVAVFDLGASGDHTSIYAVRKNLNTVRGITISESPTAVPSARSEPGRSMFEGGTGIGNGQFQEPRGLCVDSKNRVYVADTRNYRLQVFDRNGTYFGQIGERGPDAGQFEEPMDVAIDGAGRIYVLDTWNHRIQVFDIKGDLQRMITQDFYGPRGIAIDPKTNFIYVADTGHHVVKVFNSNGQPIRVIGKTNQLPGGGEGEFNAPVGIDVTADGRVIVADTLNDRVQIFNRQGEYLSGWPVGFTIQPNRGVEAHLVAAPDGAILVTDPLGGRVLAFGRDGSKIATWDRAGTGDRFKLPNGLALAPGGGLLVTDLHWHKVMRLRIP